MIFIVSAIVIFCEALAVGAQPRSGATAKNGAEYKYMTYDEMTKALNKYAENRTLVTLKVLETTFERRNIYSLKISKDSRMPFIFIDAGVHAREWIAPAATFQVIDKLLGADGSDLIGKFQFMFVPMVNPDGYVYSHKDNTTRLWRKNRAILRSETCVGVDVNRNFPFKWDKADADSKKPCHETYRGPSSSSEKETKAIRSVFKDLGKKIKLYLNVHSFGQYILLPYGYDETKQPANYRTAFQYARTAVPKLASLYNVTYTVGQISILVAQAAGNAVDYAVGDQKLNFAYAVELPGTKSGKYKFELPPEYIPKAGNHLWTIMKEIAANIPA